MGRPYRNASDRFQPLEHVWNIREHSLSAASGDPASRARCAGDSGGLWNLDDGFPCAQVTKSFRLRASPIFLSTRLPQSARKGGDFNDVLNNYPIYATGSVGTRRCDQARIWNGVPGPEPMLRQTSGAPVSPRPARRLPYQFRTRSQSQQTMCLLPQLRGSGLFTR